MVIGVSGGETFGLGDGKQPVIGGNKKEAKTWFIDSTPFLVILSSRNTENQERLNG